jgi:type III secretory pathway component EscT
MGMDMSKISLRDHFATGAMNGIVAGIYSSVDMMALVKNIQEEMGVDDSGDAIAVMSYRIADSMLKHTTGE